MLHVDDGVLASDRRHILDRSADLWEPLRGRRVFITGGTGFVGTWLLEAFAAANDAFGLSAAAVVLTRDPSRFAARAPRLYTNPALSFVTGDATSFELPGGEFTYVIHAATERAFEADASQPLSIVDRDFAATRRVLDFCASRDVKRLLFTSSGAVYGASAANLSAVSESFEGAPDPTQSRAAYGESKRLSEFACASYARVFGFDAVIARLFAFAGPYLPLDEGYAVGNFVADALSRRPINIAGDGTPRRSYLYAADLAIWLWTLLVRGQAGTPYNVGSPDGITIRQLAEEVVRTLAPGTSVIVAREAAPGAAPSSYVPSTRRAQELGLQAWIDLPEALRRTYRFYQSARGTTVLS